MEQSHSTERMYDDLTSANIHISSISWIFLNQLLLEVFSKGEKRTDIIPRELLRRI